MKRFAYLIILLAMLVCVHACHQDKKPNFVFILIDDLGWTDLGYAGSDYYKTPAIDLLAGQGMIFTNAYSNAANCAPTRASLLSGQYSPRHGIYTVGVSTRGKSMDRRIIPAQNNKELPLEKISIAEALREAGYVSAAIGKWHVGNKPEDQGFDYGIDRADLQIRGHFHKNGDYLTDVLTDETINFIEQNNPHQTGKPFFVYLSHHAVHTPIQAKKEDISDFEEATPNGCHNHATYAAMIRSVDQSVERIHTCLEELQLSENTLMIFFSDNGGHGTFTCQQPLRGGKGMYYEGGIRVPMFAYWPGQVKSGSTCDDALISTDFYPTFLELAGLDRPKNYVLDGESILPLLQGKKPLDRPPLFWHFPAYLQSYAGLRSESRDTLFRTRPVSVIRKGDFKLMLYHEEWALDGGEEAILANNAVELYDLKNDIGERNNLALSHTNKRNELLNELWVWLEETKAYIPVQNNPEYQGHEK